MALQTILWATLGANLLLLAGLCAFWIRSTDIPGAFQIGRVLGKVPRFLPLGLLVLLLPSLVWAQEVRPRITLGGRGLVSLNTDVALISQDRETELINDFSDTYLLLRLDRKLYGVNRGQVMGTVIGFAFPDADSRLGQIYFTQAHVFWWSQGWELLVGRSRLENFVVEFPTLRDDDLVDYAYVLNAFSDAPATEYDLYGNVARITFFQHQARLMERIQLSNLTVTDTSGIPLDQFGIQGASVEMAYRLPEPVRFSGRIRKLGVRYDVQKLEGQDNTLLHEVTAGLALNLTLNPLANWEFRLQGSYTPGVGALQQSTFRWKRDLARAQSYSVVASLSFLRSPYQVPRLYVALTGALRAYPDQGERRMKVVTGAFYQVGAGMDIGVQYEYETVSSGLVPFTGYETNHSLKLLLSFAYETMFNDYFMDRETILNLEHGFAP